MVFELLTFRRLRTEQRPPGGEQVGARKEEVPVDQEVLLLRTGGTRRRWPSLCPNSLSIRWACVLSACMRAQQRRLLVQRLARPRHERRRDAQRRAVGIIEDVGGLVTSQAV